MLKNTSHRVTSVSRTTTRDEIQKQVRFSSRVTRTSATSYLAEKNATSLGIANFDFLEH